jgi:hypothetical protein
MLANMGTHFERCSSFPNRSIIQQHMLKFKTHAEQKLTGVKIFIINYYQFMAFLDKPFTENHILDVLKLLIVKFLRLDQSFSTLFALRHPTPTISINI